MQVVKKELLKANPKIVCREEEGEALLFNPQSGGIKMLNRVGYEVWKLCDGSLTLDEITEKMKEEYPNTPEGVIKEDVANFINYMEELELIERVF